MKNYDGPVSLGRAVGSFGSIVSAALLLAGCGAAVDAGQENLSSTNEAITTEDGLADAFATFKQVFTSDQFDQRLVMGYGFHPGLSTEKLPPAPQGGQPPSGNVFFDFVNHTLNATIQGVPAGANFDLYFVKNVAGAGRTFKPETGDQLVKIGTFAAPGPNSRCFGQPACLSIDDLTTTNVDFDLDLVVVTRKGQSPTTSRIAVGARTLFEKRFFRERKGQTLDPVTGTVANNVETTDQLVGRGAQLFFNETFGGNGRTCGTCHRAENNLTIDPTFIKTLPPSDPLFVFKTNPALKDLEDETLLRGNALIRENVDGFDDPTHKFVQRAVNHLFSLGLTNDIGAGGFGGFPFAPPDQRLGWGGDGSPGRGTLHEFAFGAVVQHFTKDLARRPGTDFRIPTQEELDALEAFQLFSGRQTLLKADNLVPRDPHASSGQNLFRGQGQCTFCHQDLFQTTFNPNFDTGVATLTPNLPPDNGFLDGSLLLSFNVPPLIEAADSAPLFHNNSAATIEDAVAFYVSANFRNSRSALFIDLDVNQQGDIAAFLRVMNAAENVQQIRKRVTFVRDHRSTGNSDMLKVAIADTQDAIDDLSQKGLDAAAVNELQDVKTTLNTALANPDANRPAFMDHAIVFLNLIKAELFSQNPDDQF